MSTVVRRTTVKTIDVLDLTPGTTLIATTSSGSKYFFTLGCARAEGLTFVKGVSVQSDSKAFAAQKSSPMDTLLTRYLTRGMQIEYGTRGARLGTTTNIQSLRSQRPDGSLQKLL